MHYPEFIRFRDLGRELSFGHRIRCALHRTTMRQWLDQRVDSKFFKRMTPVAEG
jgi:hypothetical protein